jgi:hypothetical protein
MPMFLHAGMRIRNHGARALGYPIDRRTGMHEFGGRVRPILHADGCELPNRTSKLPQGRPARIGEASR